MASHLSRQERTAKRQRTILNCVPIPGERGSPIIVTTHVETVILLHQVK